MTLMKLFYDLDGIINICVTTLTCLTVFLIGGGVMLRNRNCLRQSKSTYGCYTVASCGKERESSSCLLNTSPVSQREEIKHPR